MAKHILAAMALACWLAVTSFALAYLAPLMLFSTRPEMVLVAFAAPALWLVISLLVYIAWADSGWRERWEAPVCAPRPHLTPGRPLASHH